MVTIKAQCSPLYAGRYYREHLCHDDYYSDRQHTAGQWFGRGCETLGLDSKAPVQQDDFLALCKGLRPDDGTRLTQRASANRRCLYDITISAPKSVSIMSLLAGDERLFSAHDHAVATTLRAAEGLAQARVRKGAAVDSRQNRQTGNLVCARFPHRESRALDPQIHTHCVTFNVTQDPVEKRMKALEARQFFDRATDLTRLYRVHLAQSLRDLGYQTYFDGHGCPQIRGVSTELLDRFSKRSSQRDTLVALREQDLRRSLTNAEISHLIHQSRTKKQQHIDSAAVRLMQIAQLSPEDRLSLEQVMAQALASARPLPPRIFIPRQQPSLALGHGLDWIAMLRVALLAVRVVKIGANLFDPPRFPQEVLRTVRFVRQVQRTTATLRRTRSARQSTTSR